MADVITLSDSDSDVQEEDVSNLPSREECEERCQRFAEITATDTALAMFYLQDREWNVEQALNAYYAEKGISDQAFSEDSDSTTASAAPSLQSSSHSKPSPAAGATEDTDGGDTKKTGKTMRSYLTTQPPLLQPKNESRIRVLSWNIDGLDPDNLQSRTEGACRVLIQENPEVIFLQEVVDRSLKIIQAKCENYQVFPGAEADVLVPGAYFTAMLLRKDCVALESVNLADFPTTRMARNLLEIQCKVKDIRMTLLTSHLESTAEYSEERQRQLKISFDRMKQTSADQTVIFGGDLNLREKDLKGASAKPDKIYDIWEVTGKRPEAKFTWDLTINDNKQLGLKFQPRCRFDRMYVRHAKEPKVKPVYFELVGIQRLSACQRFPSDHWGILAHFDVKT